MADNSPDRFDAMDSSCRLLLVEDSENDFLLLLHEIRRSGLAAEAQRVATEADLRNALGQTAWDLILCDYNLPGLGGLTAMDIVKQHDRDLPVIMVSGVRGEEFAVETMQAGAGDYVTKDNLSRLAPAIRRELGAREARAARRRADAALQGRNRRLALLSQLAERLLAAPKAADAASAAFGIIAGELDLQVYFNFLLEADDRLRLDSFSGIPDRLARLITHLKKGEAVCGVVAETGQPWHFEDIQSSGEKRVRLLRQCGLQAYFCSPLQAGNRLLGTLSFGTRSRPRFTDEELDFMRTVVRFVALAGERLRTERELQRSERRFRQLAEALPQLVWSARPDGRVDYYNERQKEFAGFAQRPDGTWEWTPVLHPDDLPRTLAVWEAARRSGTLYEVEHRVQKIDGQFYWLLSRAIPLRNEAGEVVKWLGTGTEIDHLKRTEAALSESEERFRAFFENAVVGAVEMDLDAHFLQVNDRFCEITGYRREELIGRTPHEITRPEERQKEEQGFRKILSGEANVLEMEKKYIHKSGRSVWVQENTFGVRQESGHIVRLFAIVQDISARRDAAMERDRLLAQLDATFQSMVIAVIIYDAQGGIRRMNRTAEEIFRYSPDAQTKPIAERLSLLRPETIDHLPYPLERHPSLRALAGETVLSEVMVYHPLAAQRPVWVAVGAAPIRTPDGQIAGAVSTMTDITALHDLQQERDLYVHTISHDLRTPLSVVLGHAELLDTVCGAEAAHEHIEAIEAGAERMDRMIGDMVEAARMEGGDLALEKEAVVLDDFLADLLRRSSAALDLSRITLDVADSLPPVPADPDRLERILLNLLTNALKYSPAEAPVTVSAQAVSGAVEICVRDRGRGIHPEDLPHIFRRFYRPRNGRKADSVGLGLYIVRSLVEAHGGRVRVESTPGEGSTFIFTLPLASSSLH